MIQKINSYINGGGTNELSKDKIILNAGLFVLTGLCFLYTVLFFIFEVYDAALLLGFGCVLYGTAIYLSKIGRYEFSKYLFVTFFTSYITYFVCKIPSDLGTVSFYMLAVGFSYLIDVDKKLTLYTLALTLLGFLFASFQTFILGYSLGGTFLTSLKFSLVPSSIIIMYFIIRHFKNRLDLKIQEKEEETNKLKDINKSLEHFSYIVSHDLKAPLQNINTLVQFIDKDHKDELSEEAMEIFTMISACTTRLDDLITAILEYSKSGQKATNIEKIDVANLIEDAKNLIEIPDGFRVDYSKSLPSIIGSRTQLEQVLVNLIGNAIKYHDKKTGNIQVLVNPIDKDFLKFEVSDDGPGIKDKYQNKVFEIFGSANETSRTDSTGVGLAIVKKLVEVNCGEIKLVSEYGKGSTFLFTWPSNANKVQN
ncbi:MAG: ATP-binding protein [Flavobacteriia bacterium]|nr:ATP-binding protein [Flavobacteriia bacterium]